MEAEVFLDTAYAIALAAVSDQYHALAVALADELEAQRTRLVTTQAVLLEIGNALSAQRYRAAAVQLLLSLESDPGVTIVPLTPQLYSVAFHLYQNRPDKEWGLVDCVSFVVMSERGLREALTPDRHFEQAGFIALLKPQP
jgi:hypothetical protein